MTDKNIDLKLDEEITFAPLIDEKGARISEFKKRKSSFETKSIHNADEKEFLQDGWEIQKRYKKKTRIKRPKKISALLEDRIWSLFYKMGYTILSEQRIKITYTRKDGSKGYKFLDVLASDDETTIICECKTRKTWGSRPLQLYLHETLFLKEYFHKANQKQFGKKKLLLFYCTLNIAWSQNDIDRAQEGNINIIDDRKLEYYEEFINHLGPAGRFQFLGEFLSGQKIPNLDQVKVPAIRMNLGGHTAYSFVTTPERLLKISYVNHHDLDHPLGQPAYQRMIKKPRIKEIGKYIENKGFFPTNLLINFKESLNFDQLPKKVNLDKNIKFGLLSLPRRYKSAWIIDGQHRLYGYSHLEDKFLKQPLQILAFEKLDNKTEADLFIDINSKQTKVPAGVLASLKADLRIDSDHFPERMEAIASRIFKNLNDDPKSIFFNEIKVRESDKDKKITLPEAVKQLSRSGLLGKQIKQNIVPGPFTQPTDDETIKRACNILNSYFDLLANSNIERWKSDRTFDTRSNFSIRANIRLIEFIIKYLNKWIEFMTCADDVFIEDISTFVAPYFEYNKTATDEDFEKKFKGKYGEGGVKDYFFKICEIISDKDDKFGPEELLIWKQQQQTGLVYEMDQKVGDIHAMVLDFVIDKLKEIHGKKFIDIGGEKISAYWYYGIEKQSIRDAAKAKWNEDSAIPEKRPPVEAFLSFIHLADVIKQKSNWEHFEKFLSIPLPGEKGKKYYVDWIDKYNMVRRPAAHKTKYRIYHEEDIEYIRWLYDELKSRLS